MTSTPPPLVAFVAFEGMRLLDLTGPLDVFSVTSDMLAPTRPRPYRLQVVSERGGEIRSSSGLALVTQPLRALDDVEIDTLIVAGGASALRGASNPAAAKAWLASQAGLVDWIAGRGRRVRRICSICTGAFLLAGAGLLDGCRAATHWDATALLKACFPAVLVEADPVFVRDGPLWTSGGVTSGIDLALALVEDDLGSRTALQTARLMVVFVKRPGGQSQFSAPLAAQFADPGNFAELHAWMMEHLGEDLTIDRLAERAGMSRRTFMRTYTANVGRTPGKMLEAMRLAAARLALEETNRPIKQIARESGFGDEDRMRRTFQRELGVGPTAYRTHFSAMPAKS